MDVGRIIYAVFFVAAILFFLRNCYRLLALICLGHWENRFDHLSVRLWNMLKYAFGQVRVIQQTYGYNHLLIFWGFMTLLVMNTEFLIAGLFPRFSFSFLGNIPYGLILFTTDIVSVLVLAAVAIAFARRIFFKPPHIEATFDAFVILGMIAMLMIAYFGYHAGEIHLEETAWSAWMPVSTLLARWYQPLSHQPAVVWTGIWWWIHALVLLVFLNYLPYSKHLHVLTAIPNCFFKRFDYPRTVPRIEFKMGNRFGVSSITQFSWKDLLDFLSCTECGRCQSACPAYATGKNLNPKEIIHQGKYNLFINGADILKNRRFDTLISSEHRSEYTDIAPLIGENRRHSVAEDALWACTTCGSCMTQCPVFIEHVPKIIEMRRHLVMEQAKFPEELLLFFQNTEQRSNPWGIAPTDRAKWAQDLNVPFMEEGKEVDYLFYVGCSGAYDSRSRNIVVAMVNILNASGLSWGTLGNEERCCGDSVRRLGNEYVFEQMALENIKIFKKYNVKRIVTICPHGYTTFKNDYKQYGADFQVLHHTELIDQLIRENKLPLQPNGNGRVVFHDSCYLGRYNGIFDAPRNILTQVSNGAPPTEMPRCGQNSFCCGAGGGRMWLEENVGKRIYIERTREALAENPTTIAVACPFCMTMFEDGVKQENKEDSVRVRDIAEIVAESML